MLRQVSLLQNTILLASLASLGLIPVNTVSPLCVHLFRCYFSPHYSRVEQEGGGIVSLPPFSSSLPPRKLLFPASVLLCWAGTRRNKFDCLWLYELRLQRVWKNCQLCRLLNLNQLEADLTE